MINNGHSNSNITAIATNMSPVFVMLFNYYFLFEEIFSKKKSSSTFSLMNLIIEIIYSQTLIVLSLVA